MKLIEQSHIWNIVTYISLEHARQLGWRYANGQFHLYAYYPGDNDEDALCVVSISEEPFKDIPNEELAPILNKMMSLVLDCNILSKQDLQDSLEHAARYIIEKEV